MKKTLIDFDVLKRMEEDSLSSAEHELVLAEDVLSSALDRHITGLHCFSDQDVIYETLDGSYIHANYDISECCVTFDNIQEMVVDESSEASHAHEQLNQMIDLLLEGKELEANDKFKEYMELPVVRRDLNEIKYVTTKQAGIKRGKLRGKKQPRWIVSKRTRARVKSLKKRSKGEKGRAARIRAQKKRGMPKRKRARIVGRWKQNMYKECLNLSQNVLEFVDYKELGPTMRESVAKHDALGNPIALRIPNSKTRNEARLLSFNWKVLDHKCKTHRNAGKKLAENQAFIKAVVELKKNHGISDNSAFEESLDSIVSQWPDVLYLTQTELAHVLGISLETAGIRNFDDEMCNFLSEGILRKAHGAYTDRVDTIFKLANVNITEEIEDDYVKFQQVVELFFPTLDENEALEMQVFVDLYNTVREVYNEAARVQDEILAEEAADNLRDLSAVIARDMEPDFELAEEVAEWLYSLVETNLNMGDWQVSNTPHMTVSGDHPAMAEKARKGYSPASDFSGDWGDIAPVSDGKNYRGDLADKMRNSSYGNVGVDTFPVLQNPYVPAPFGDYTMKGEKGVDKEEDSGLVMRRGNTWPELQNPYVPDAPGADGWRAKTDNLVIDK